MKKATVFFTCILALGLFACDDESEINPNLSENFIEANKNDVSWLGQSELRLDNDTLLIFGVANRPNDEVLVMKIQFNGVGTYELNPKHAYYYTSVGGDVITSQYKQSENAVGTLEIVAYNKSKSTVEGDFRLTLKKIHSNPENGIETINFKDGRFRGTIAD